MKSGSKEVKRVAEPMNAVCMIIVGTNRFILRVYQGLDTDIRIMGKGISIGHRGQVGRPVK